MRLTYTRALYLALFVAAAVFALRPVEGVDRAIAALLAPTRVFVELAGPFEWLRGGRVDAAVEHLAATAEREQALRAELYADEWRFTLPAYPFYLIAAALALVLTARSLPGAIQRLRARIG